MEEDIFETDSPAREESDELTEHPDYKSEIIGIITGNDSPKIMQQRLEDYHGNDIANVLEDLDTKDRRKLFRICRAAMVAEVFEYVEEDTAGEYLTEMDLQKAAAVMGELETDTAAALLQTIERSRRELIIDALRPEIRDEIKLVASFDEDEIGSRLTTNFIEIGNGLTIKEAMKELVRQAAKNDNITTLFISDEDGEYCGAIDLKDLITARSTDDLNDLIVTSFPYLYAHETIDECIEKLKSYSEDLIPVLDNSNRLIGVITAQSVIEVVDDEMGEDYAKFAGITAEEDLNEGLFESMKKRLPWLLILLGLGMLVSAVIGIFEGIIAELTIIMAFQSLILGMSGNVGTQSLAVTLRVLMDENLTARDKRHLVFKEMRVGLSNGVLLGTASFIFLGLYIMIFKDKAPEFSFAVSSCIGIAMIVAMLISSTVGTLIPLFFKKIKIDPAVASGPLITTINDLVSAVTYYSTCWLLLINILHLQG
ncbi:MAG: magnesium transporter [Oscillospiraceae bacterium]|nr:magnesium transporter [Oscillospiraceae bacterium]